VFALLEANINQNVRQGSQGFGLTEVGALLVRALLVGGRAAAGVGSLAAL
jgi:hypothetical protein